MNTCICMFKSLCYSPETITPLLISYSPIQNKVFLKKKKNTMCKIPGVSETRYAQGTERKSTGLGHRLESEKGVKKKAEEVVGRSQITLHYVIRLCSILILCKIVCISFFFLVFIFFY